MEEEVYQFITKLLDGKTTLLSFTSPSIPAISIKDKIHLLTKIPTHSQILISNSKILSDHTQVFSDGSTVHLSLRLRGGKGGFGSLLRGAATKAGQKKTNNFDACRDMSGRRLRHVNAEKKMEEWRGEEEDRRMERLAEEFIKKKVKVAKKDGSDKVEKYVDKYRKDSMLCMEEVDKTVRESFAGFGKDKRKGVERNGVESKRLKIWMGKRKMNESDSDDTDEDDSDDEMGDKNEKSVVINNESHSDSNKDEEGSSGSITGGKLDGELSAGGLTESGSEEEKETRVNGRSESPQIPNGPALNGEDDDPTGPQLKINEESMVQNKESGDVEEMICKPTSISHVEVTGSSEGENSGDSDLKPLVVEETTPVSTNIAEEEKPLNFDDFNSAAEMEVLGMEKLKTELQARGLKCGGTLQERAARLFLLKTTPVDKLPKKLLAKK